MKKLQERLDALGEGNSNDEEIDGLREIIEELRAEIRDFANTFPGSSQTWQSVQNWASRILGEKP